MAKIQRFVMLEQGVYMVTLCFKVLRQCVSIAIVSGCVFHSHLLIILIINLLSSIYYISEIIFKLHG
jgi:hypothetical protein